MTQYASPDSDISIGNWSDKDFGTDDIFANVVKGGGDSVYIVSDDDGGASTCKFEIQNGDDPVSSSDHIVRYRARSTNDMGMGVLPFTIALYQDSSGVRTVENNSLTTSLANYSFTLTGPEADSITDYNELQLWLTRGTVMMGDLIEVSETYFEYPDASTPAAPAAVAKNQPESFVMFID